MHIDDSLEKFLMLGKTEGRRRRRHQRMRCLDGITDAINLGKFWEIARPGMLQSTGSQRVCHDWVTEQQELKRKRFIFILYHCNSGNSIYRYTDTHKKVYIY